MEVFSARIFKIGINPYVIPPKKALDRVFEQAGKDKGPIPIHGSLNGHAFTQTLVKYAGKWRLYLNTPMRQAAGIDVGDTARVTMEYDPAERIVPMHPKLKAAFAGDKLTKKKFDSLPPSRQKEIVRYIGFLKTEESVDRNVKKVIQFLNGKERFIGRDKP